MYEKTDIVAAANLLPVLWQQASNEPLQLSLQRIAKRVQKGVVNMPQWAALLTLLNDNASYAAPTSQMLTLSKNAELSVEQRVVEHFRAQGVSAFFCENSLLCGLFGLAFWDIIFAPIVGAFDNPYQRAPRDMYHSSFVDERRDLIDLRMVELKAGNYQAIEQHFATKQGISNDWVNWPLLTDSLLGLALQHFSAAFIVAVCQRILKDPAHYRSGQPDLVTFDAQGAVQFVEVKGPGDSLADHQGYWLSFLQQFYPASVCYVQWHETTSND
ncbi:hypothetical protein HR45_03415 [Shewanella mangrovi]|uniref:VRR-NUC domain-containing protein n=1 Tax=Shewanella mangrovi TaxID=1515746 RepID=A0A094JEZ8_9GAMM|nr:VRR-NUC domain-containing protein [Shewanella mangrovi]KFZ38490.1 hypothetical protein HR45_03415 [Shewanella mangrovi]